MSGREDLQQHDATEVADFVDFLTVIGFPDHYYGSSLLGLEFH